MTLHQILVHMVDEVARHAGHLDVVRELIDGTVGRRGVGENMAPGDETWWAAYVEQVEQAARDRR